MNDYVARLQWTPPTVDWEDVEDVIEVSGGDPASVAFCHSIHQNYVSCSPFRVPIARLAAAQAALKEKGFKAK